MTRSDGGGPDRAAAAAPRDQPFQDPEARLDGHQKVTGAARFAADLKAPGMLWASYARSPHAHARIVSVDVSAAAAMAGVHAVLTGADLRPARIGRRLLDWPVLAWDRVRFIGDRVAAIAAETPELARRAADRVRVEYEVLPGVFDPEAALEPGAPLLHEPDEARGYPWIGGERPLQAHPNIQGSARVRRGQDDIDQVFRRAHRVFEHRFIAPRQHQGHLEPHATLVSIDQGQTRVRSTNKTPFLLRRQMGLTLGIDPATIEIDSRYIGGDFGGKGLSLDEYACWFLARATGRPIKAVMDYSDELQAANPRHAAIIRLSTAVDTDGRFIAHRSRILFDGGAYAAGKPSESLIPPGGLGTFGPYVVPNVDLEVVTTYTNTTPGGHMRAPGEAQALFASESHIDEIAAGLELDPIELRLRNVVRAGDEGPTGVRYDAPRAVEVLETLRTASAWQTPLPPNTGRGVGLSVRRPGGGSTTVSLGLTADGRIELLTGAPDQGGGIHTALQRMAADLLSVDMARIQVTVGTTSTAPNDAGLGGSRGTYLAGRALERAARDLRTRLETLAAARLGHEGSEVRLVDDRFVITDEVGETTTVPFDTALTQASIPSISGTFDSRAEGIDDAIASFVGYVAEVSVDPETGAVDVRQVTLVADVGTIINPVAHRGQLTGGFVFGLGCTMMEAIGVEDGRVTTTNLGDYRLPTSVDVPPLRVILLPPTPGSGAYGAKMAGELTNSVIGPAIANAVAAAVHVRLDRFPLTAETVYDALQRIPSGAPAVTP